MERTLRQPEIFEVKYTIENIVPGNKNFLVHVLVDTGATHNFVYDKKVQRLGLSLTGDGSKIKADNSEAKPVGGLAKMYH